MEWYYGKQKWSGIMAYISEVVIMAYRRGVVITTNRAR
jgi:hypothetical protein